MFPALSDRAQCPAEDARLRVLTTVNLSPLCLAPPPGWEAWQQTIHSPPRAQAPRCPSLPLLPATRYEPGMQLSNRAAAREAASRDVLAADLRCSFFASALQSYKRDSVLRPFPASYARHDCKDFEALVSPF